MLYCLSVSPDGTAGRAAASCRQPDCEENTGLENNTTGALEQQFAKNGFLVLPGIVPREPLAELHTALSQQFRNALSSGALFAGGGQVSGHLNCAPGWCAKFAYDALQEHGIIDLIKRLDPKVVRMPNIGCNFNLPGSHTQHFHTDRPFTRDFMIVNVAVVDTVVENGAMEVIPGTHRRLHKYAHFVLQREYRNAIRVPLNRGDVLIRTSNVWHRGTANHSSEPRPMLAFTWEDGGSELPVPFAAEGGEIRFRPNWFKPTLAGRLREQLFVKLPIVYSTLRFGRSLVDRDY